MRNNKICFNKKIKSGRRKKRSLKSLKPWPCMAKEKVKKQTNKAMTY